METLAILGAILALSTVVLGASFQGRRSRERFRLLRPALYAAIGLNLLWLVGTAISIPLGFSSLLSGTAFAAPLAQSDDSFARGMGYLAAAISTGAAAIGAGIGVGIAGAAAIGAMAERPEVLGRALIIVGLAEGVAIYGLVISILILGKL